MADFEPSLTVPSRAERPVVAQLLELNAYEFSALDARPIGEDGRYGYTYLDLYWSEPGRTPYLVRVESELAGFALVRNLPDDTHTVAEFLILPKFRRHGVGQTAARHLFQQHRGRWQIKQLGANTTATAFWRQAIPTAYDEVVHEDGSVIQTFSN